MYIPAFWCGVIATVVFEIGMIIGVAIVSVVKDRSKEAKQILDGEEGKNVHKDD